MTKAATGAPQWQKASYDFKAWEVVLEPDDCVLVRIFAFEGKHKLSNKSNYVESQPNPVPVYILYKEADRSSKRTLHRNHLLPIGHASDARTDSQGTSSNQEMTNKHRPRKRTPDASDKEGTFTQFLDKSKSAHKLWGWGWKWVLAEVHEMKMTDSQEGEVAATLTAQEGEQCCDETALQWPDDSPGTYVGAWDTSWCGDDHHFTDVRGRKFCRPAVYSDQESACSGKQKMTEWCNRSMYIWDSMLFICWFIFQSSASPKNLHVVFCHNK